ncbi:MAG: alpha/beta fold hydrolase [Methanobacterium sp.]
MNDKPYITDSVTSKDGTKIGYRQFGSGPGIILMHGGANASQHFMRLGDFLCDCFTVFIPDRRGRGLSGPIGENYSMQREIEDLDAIIQKTGARYIFGLSSGALIALQATLKLPSIKKTALYELPLDINGSIMELLSFVPQFDAEIAEGNLSNATVTMLKEFGIYFGIPSWITDLPRSVLVTFFKLYYVMDSRIIRGDDVSFTVLVPAFHYDYELVCEMQGKLETFKDVDAEVLLIGGSKSPQFLKDVLDALEEVLPHVERVELRELSHSGPLVSGNPERVALELKHFFLYH